MKFGAFACILKKNYKRSTSARALCASHQTIKTCGKGCARKNENSETTSYSQSLPPLNGRGYGNRTGAR